MSEGLIVLYALIVWTVVLTGVALFLRMRHGRPTARDMELEQLRARYARGEMSYTEYERRRQDLASENRERSAG